MLLTSNSDFRVKLQGDENAWRRRLRSVEHDTPPPRDVIAGLSEDILSEEVSGVSFWYPAEMRSSQTTGRSNGGGRGSVGNNRPARIRLTIHPQLMDHQRK